jgi:transcriptional regulator with XRE-family HTH domain
MRTKKGPPSERQIWLAKTIREIRESKGLTQEQVSERIPTYYGDSRSIRRIETAEHRPDRNHLLALLMTGLGIRDVEEVNRILIQAGFDKANMDDRPKDNVQEKKLESPPSPEIVHWAPTRGREAGILINAANGSFIPWTELKKEVERGLLSQLANTPVPPGSAVKTDMYNGRRDYIVRIISPEGNVIGSVWFGPDPDNNWAFDGLVRVGWAKSDGAPETVVWQKFQRYSDGSYRRLAAYD